MRISASAVLLSLLASAAWAQTTSTPSAARPSTTGGKPAAQRRAIAGKPATAQKKSATAERNTVPEDPKATEGLAAAGTMPAATGSASPLYTLRYVDLRTGTGEPARTSAPGAIVFYTVHYTGWLTDGTKFDSSVDRGEPFVFPVGAKRVITAWDTGFEGMRVGGKRRLIVPYQLAYGAAGHPPVIPEKADLIFDVELLGQGDTPQPVVSAPAAAGTSTPAKPAERPEEHQE